jgi:hypothetical protein
MRFTYDQAVPALRFRHEDQFGNRFHIVVVRHTYAMTREGLVLQDEQPALRTADAYFGEPFASSVRAESELAPYKPHCDVIVNATAWAPGGAATRQVTTSLRLERTDADGDMRLIDKSLDVTGERWLRRHGLLSRLCLASLEAASLGSIRLAPWRLTPPVPVTALPVQYEFAYGGACRVDALPAERERLRRRIGSDNCLPDENPDYLDGAGATTEERPLAHAEHEANPVGCGFARPWHVAAQQLDCLPVPRITAAGAPLTARDLWQAMHGAAEPGVAGYGCVDRAWLPRSRLAGMDQPAGGESRQRPAADFDYAWWNAAPRDQQCEHLQGGERLTLVNLCRPGHPMATRSADGDTVLSFPLPAVQPYLALTRGRQPAGARPLLLDTVLVEPEKSTVVLTWRIALPVGVVADHAELGFACTDDEKARLAALVAMMPSCGHEDDGLAAAA